MLPISAKFLAYGEKVERRLREADVRVGIDRSDERIQAKIKAGAEEKIPYLLIVGGKDESAGTVSVRRRAVGDEGATPLEEFVGRIVEETRSRSLPVAPASGGAG